MSEVLVFEQVGAVIGGVRVLDEVCFTLAPGEVLTVVGDSGAGKSTLARLAGALAVPSDGQVRVFGHDTAAGDAGLRRRIGMALQGGSLLAELSVEDNLKLGLGPGNANAWRAHLPRVDRLLYEFGIEDLAETRVAALPTGARRQLEVVRALLRDPELLILDEPFEGAAAHVGHLAEAVRRAARRRGSAVLVLTQDGAVAPLLGGRVATLWHGRLQQSDEVSAPAAASLATAAASEATLA